MDDVEKYVESIIEHSLIEDATDKDITTETLISREWQGEAYFLSKTEGVLAGIQIACKVFSKIDPQIKFNILIQDGNNIKKGDILARVSGSLAAILKGERTALNFLQHLSGIATETARYVHEVSGLPVKILDTRKTTPGLRWLEKYAVRTGGGQNHRLNLSDGILVKDNHLEILYQKGKTMKDIVSQLKGRFSDIKIEVETRTLEEVKQAVEAGADIIMLDNMDLESMKKAVELINRRALTEASGNITLQNVRQVAETGVDFISVGAITHSAKALDISLEYERL